MTARDYLIAILSHYYAHDDTGPEDIDPNEDAKIDVDAFAHELAEQIRSQSQFTVDASDSNAQWFHAANLIDPIKQLRYDGEIHA